MGLDVVDLVMRVEQEFGITIDDLDAAELGTVGQLHRYVLRKLDRGAGDDGVRDRLTAIIAEHAGVARDRVTDEKSFVHDFGMD
jgi:acyl carrier protein